MTAPTLHEQRPDAEVVVYGDTAPISDAEWHCARLAFALRGEPLRIESERDGWWSCDSMSFVVRREDERPSRAEAVAVRAAWLATVAAGHIADHEARAARLRALLGGSAS